MYPFLREDLILSTLPAMERVCEAFPPLTDDVISLLIQVLISNLSHISYLSNISNLSHISNLSLISNLSNNYGTGMLKVVIPH